MSPSVTVFTVLKVYHIREKKRQKPSENENKNKNKFFVNKKKTPRKERKERIEQTREAH